MFALKNSFAVLDIGSSKITALTGERGVNGTFAVGGMAEVEYDGFSEGQFFNIAKFKTAIKSAVCNLAESAKRQFGRIYIGVPGAFIRLENRKFRTMLGRKRRIKQRDIDELFEAGKEKIATAGYEIIYASDIYFALDDNRRVLEPVGNISSVLGGYITYELCEKYFTSAVRTALSELKINDIKFVYDGYCEGRALLGKDTSDAPALIVDVGYITTSSTIFSGNGIYAKDSFDYGGGLITAGLVESYGLSPEAAEFLKREISLGFICGGKSHYTVDDGGEVKMFPVEEVNELVVEMLDALAENIDTFLTENSSKITVSNIYLSGGGISAMRGAKEHLAGRLGQTVELLKPKAPQYNKASYASIIGLLDFALYEQDRHKKRFLI